MLILTEVCERPLFPFILSERWNDLSTNATYYKQSRTKKSHKLSRSILQNSLQNTTKTVWGESSPPAPAPTQRANRTPLGRDGDPHGRRSAGIFRHTDQVRFASLLQRADGGTLELQVGFEILGDLPHQPLERQLPNQKMGGFLVRTDFSEGNGPGPVAMSFCHPAGRGVAFPGRFDDQLFVGRFPTRGFTSGPLGPGHFL